MHLHQRPLGGDNVVRLAVLVDEPGVGLDPLPPVVLGEQPEDGETALARLYHWNHIRRDIGGSVSLLFTFWTPRRVHTLILHLLSRACCCDGGYMLMFTLGTCACYKSCLHTFMQPNTHSYTITSLYPNPSSPCSVSCLSVCVILVQVVFLCCLVSKQSQDRTSGRNAASSWTDCKLD